MASVPNGRLWRFIKGWDSRDPLEYWREFSAGPIFIIVATVISAIIALVIITNQNQAKNLNQASCGVFTLLSGLAILGAGGATFNALDTALQNEGIAANQGVGLWLGCLSGLAITILGIVILAAPKATQVR